MLAVNPYPHHIDQTESLHGGEGSEDYFIEDVTEKTSVSERSASHAFATAEDGDEKALLLSNHSTSSTSDDEREGDQPRAGRLVLRSSLGRGPSLRRINSELQLDQQAQSKSKEFTPGFQARKPSLTRNASDRFQSPRSKSREPLQRSRSKSRERPQRTRSGQIRGLLRSNSAKSMPLGEEDSPVGGGSGGGGGLTGGDNSSGPGRRLGLLEKSLSFSDRSTRRNMLKSTLSVQERLVRGQSNTAGDHDEIKDTAENTLASPDTRNSARPKMTGRANSCRDLRTSSSARNGLRADRCVGDSTTSLAGQGTGEGGKQQGNNTNNDDNTSASAAATARAAAAVNREMLDKIQHLEAKTELYKEEFKRVVQEKKHLLSGYVAETAELSEEITTMRRLLYASEEENRKLKASLDEVGIQTSSLACLTETDGLPKTCFSVCLSSKQHDDDDDDAPMTAQFLVAKRHDDSAASAGKPVEYRCDVVQGPGLLVTGVHRPSPTLFYLPGLRTLPFWTQTSRSSQETEVAYQEPSLTWAVRQFESNWEKILKEYKRVAPSVFSDYQPPGNKNNDNFPNTDHAMAKGKCSIRSYMKEGKIQSEFEETFVRTSAVLATLRKKGLLFEGVPFGSVYFCNLRPRSLAGARSSPTNLRIRLHLPIILPDVECGGNGKKASQCSIGSSASKESTKSTSRKSKKSSTGTTNGVTGSLGTGVRDNLKLADTCGLRVGPLQRKYELGKVLLLDDSFNHESWNDTDHDRVVLVVDLWHPDVTAQERKSIMAHSWGDSGGDKQ